MPAASVLVASHLCKQMQICVQSRQLSDEIQLSAMRTRMAYGPCDRGGWKDAGFPSLQAWQR